MSSNGQQTPVDVSAADGSDSRPPTPGASVEDRVRSVMERAAPQQRRYKTLQEWTGIPSDRWSAVALGRQRPTAEMLGALCLRFKELTLWLMTGRDDPRNKQWNLDTFFARKELRLSAVLERDPSASLSYEEFCVLQSSSDLAESLQDIDRIECKRSAKDIKRLMPKGIARTALEMVPAGREMLKLMKPEGTSDAEAEQLKHAPMNEMPDRQ